MLALDKQVKKIGRKALRVIEDEHSNLLLSTISLVEIAVKNQIGKLDVSPASVDKLIERLDLTVLPFTREHATALYSLPLYHTEPFDRMLIASAVVTKTPILTADANFSRYKRVQVIW